MKLSIVMYHYVRELKHSRFPDIKGLETSQFREQIKYLKKHFNIISGNELLAAIAADSMKSLPTNAMLLTFDDGYIDHFTQAFPILYRENISGSFFPSAKCILEDKVLDVNKIHFILASVSDKQILVDIIYDKLNEFRKKFDLSDNAYYWQKLAVAGRFDSKEVMFIKRMLQKALPIELRQIIISALFRKFVTSDETAMARELYVNLDQLNCMRENNMYIGSHGYDHYWLDSIDVEEQKKQIELSLDFLRRVGATMSSWIMCYPHGSYNDSLLSILKNNGCQIGLTTEVGIAEFVKGKLLTLPRLNTNDFPKIANANPNDWKPPSKS